MEVFGFDICVCVWFKIFFCVFFLVFDFVLVLLVVCFSFPNSGIVDFQSIYIFPWRSYLIETKYLLEVTMFLLYFNLCC